VPCGQLVVSTFPRSPRNAPSPPTTVGASTVPCGCSAPSGPVAHSRYRPATLRPTHPVRATTQSSVTYITERSSSARYAPTTKTQPHAAPATRHRARTKRLACPDLASVSQVTARTPSQQVRPASRQTNRSDGANKQTARSDGASNQTDRSAGPTGWSALPIRLIRGSLPSTLPTGLSTTACAAMGFPVGALHLFACLAQIKKKKTRRLLGGRNRKVIELKLQSGKFGVSWRPHK